MTGSPETRGLDPWADWLISGRHRGTSAGKRRTALKGLERVRDQLLANARLTEGQSVLDLGAGTGLLALAARRKVRATGRVIASDISPDALRECMRQAERTRNPTALLIPIVGDGLHLPFAPESFDAVLTRSVLMHLREKAAAAREMFRVVRTHGTISIFESISDVASRARADEAQEIAVTLPDYPRVRARALGDSSEGPSGFDERDLVRWFREAGFRHVKMEYSEVHRDGLGEARRESVLAMLTRRPHPNAISHEEAAREILGTEAETYMENLLAWHLARGARSHWGLVFLTATK